MKNLDIDQLRSLVAIADCGNFSGAADRVHRTQSAVSQQMKKLELTTGTSLFEKQGRNHTLTSHGVHLVSYARQILGLNDQAMAYFTSPDMNGKVRLGVCDDYVRLVFNQILRGFSDKHPNIQLSVTSAASSRLHRMVSAGKLDIALINILQEETLPVEPLFQENLVWVKSKTLEWPVNKPMPLAIESQCRWGKMAISLLQARGISFQLTITAADFHGLTAAISSGLAVGLISSCTMTDEMEIIDLCTGTREQIVQTGIIRRPGIISPPINALAEHILQWNESLKRLGTPICE
ncbi:LysR family transcriptional regulator [Veronia pacifica]|uniref:LysR family transcriptional regulator n=1 Tax=Veronia pacifica TaxID=1080227 RepID=A0A1C3EG99_9GAMM|nr:LysR substrate-binding domain-containing protein [Veronia pacifica]ODA32255.1 LysR family transcriptional regulator [Veronia pacifica]